MATSAERRLRPKEIRRFGSIHEHHAIPDLTEIQTRSYERLSAVRTRRTSRARTGASRAVLREIFPIESYDKTLRLEYLRYELGKPRYEPDECRQLRLTYGRPFKVWLRLTKEQPIEEEVYLGDMPIMLGGGEFIINGAERVVVSQLHRSPGVDFVSEMEAGERRLHSCRIIPERGSWIELNVSKKDSLSGPHRPERQVFGDDAAAGHGRRSTARIRNCIRCFYETSTEKVVDGRSAGKIEGKIAVNDVVYPAASERAGEVILESGQKITKNAAEMICTSGLTSIEVMPDSEEPADLQLAARRQHVQPRGGAAEDLSAVAAGQSAAIGKGPRPVLREILRHQPLSPGQGRTLPHQSQARAEHSRVAK